MNKLILVTCLLGIASCHGKKWYSTISKDEIIRGNTQFIKEGKIKNNQLLNQLDNFKNALISRDLDALYGFRTKEYQKVVSKDIFKSEIIGGTKLPSESYFSMSGSVIEKTSALIETYYVLDENEYEYSLKTVDKWVFDEVQAKWLFVSNSLSWGSSVIQQ